MRRSGAVLLALLTSVKPGSVIVSWCSCAIAKRLGLRPIFPSLTKQPSASCCVPLSCASGRICMQAASAGCAKLRSASRCSVKMLWWLKTCSSSSVSRVLATGSKKEPSGIPRASIPRRSCRCMPDSRNRAWPCATRSIRNTRSNTPDSPRGSISPREGKRPAWRSASQ